MKTQKRKIKAWLYLLSAVLLCGFFITVSWGAVQARYESEMQKEVSLEYQAKTNQIYLRSAEKNEDGSIRTASDGSFLPLGSWQPKTDEMGNTEEDTYVLDFLLSNGNGKGYCIYDQSASLMLVATSGLADPANLKIVLTDGKFHYSARYVSVKEGTAAYETYGPGWIYRFYNEAGEEISWEFSGRKMAVKELTITVTGTSEFPAALSLVASAGPEEK